MTKPLSPDCLAEIDARAEAATPGPWGFYDGDNYADVAADLEMTGRGSYSCRQQVARLEDESYWDDPAHEDDDEERAPEQMAADAAFIAHAREDVPALVAEVKRLRAELDAVFIAAARTDVPALLVEVERLRAALNSATDVIAEQEDEIGDWSAKNAALRAELAARPTRAEVLRETAPEMDAIAHEYGVFGVGSRLRQLADDAEAGEPR